MIPSFDEVMSITRDVSSATALEDVECLALYRCASQVPKGGCVVEVGCQLGRSSSIILQLAQSIGFHSIHIDPYTSQPEWLQGWVKMMFKVGGDFTHAFTLLCMRTEQAAWHLSKIGQIDAAYIDGGHERPDVEIDLQEVGYRVKSGGYLACHDFTNDGLLGVREAVVPYVASGWDEVGVFGSLGVWRRK
jgi:hypothetical protein